ncbi:DUF5675 family protein [Shewanella xiamenensis]|uniref:DUF5675 family protein n=1 Tax=Shewanella xiamenensis TaxID=332186 RepID=UPI000849B58E|nr:DUF5675 family protein [Shewanella xiamenensis]ODR86730.1 hypothetical protein ABT47_16175 [Shewanella xiamenensis]
MENAKTLYLKTRNIAGIGTFGELFHEGKRLCVTVEREWLNNRKSQSCIPAGTYTLRHHNSPSKGHCLALESPELGVTVLGPSHRTHCLVHSANWPLQLEGCIAPGTHFHPDKWGVANSANALKMLLALLPVGVEHQLIIERA